MIEIGDVKKDEARKGDARTSTTQTSMNSYGEPNESKNYNTHYRLSGQALPRPERRFCVQYLNHLCLALTRCYEKKLG